jgi:mRNA-degrading endonuclease RelE of RelBE toxin-antitoxin system
MLTTRRFDREFKELPAEIKQLFRGKLELYFSDNSYPYLHVKRVKGTAGIWELSLTMNYRITFQLDDKFMPLRRVGTHNVLRNP